MASDQLTLAFAALADPTCRSILTRLAEGEATANALAEPFPVSLPAISRHPKVLEHAGLIVRSREAKWQPSRLHADPLDEAEEWIQARKRTGRPGWTDSARTCAGKESKLTDPTPAVTADQQVPITRMFDAPRGQVFTAWTDPRRGIGVVRPRAHGHAAREDPRRPARRRALRVHDGPARSHNQA